MNQDFEICLNHISFGESWGNNGLPEPYKQSVRVLLIGAKRVFTETQILQNYPGSTILDIKNQNPERFEMIGFIKDGCNRDVGWLDLYDTYFIKPTDPMFDEFFAYKIKHLDLMKLDDFLNYHLVQTFENNFTGYARFLKIASRKHENMILTDKKCLTIYEWLASIRVSNREVGIINEVKQSTNDDLLDYFKREITKLIVEGKSGKNLNKGLINSKDVLGILKISQSKLFRLETNGEIPYTKIGGRRRYREEDIQKYIDKKFK